MNLLQHELRQRGRSIVAVYIDLDGFKLVNDQHGHACADDILRTMVDAARNHAPPVATSSLACR